MRAAVSARSVPCRPVCICSHLLLPNIVIFNEIDGDGDLNSCHYALRSFVCHINSVAFNHYIEFEVSASIHYLISVHVLYCLLCFSDFSAEPVC